MKQLLSFFAFFLPVLCYGQDKYFYSDSLVSLQANYCTTANGYTYMLATASNYFNHSHGMLIEGDGILGDYIYCIDSHDSLIWKKYYPLDADVYYPAIRLFADDNTLVLPYNLYADYVKCTLYSARYTRYNRYMLINAKDGAITYDGSLSGDSTCGKQDLKYATYTQGRLSCIGDKDNFGPGNIYRRTTALISGHTLISDTIHWHLNYMNVLDYDYSSKQYAIQGSGGTFLCDSMLDTIAHVNIPYDVMKKTVAYKFAFGSHYNIIRCEALPPDSARTIVTDKNNNIVSIKPTPKYAAVRITDDDHIISVRYGSSSRVTPFANKPVIITETDIFQSVLYTDSIGAAFTCATQVNELNDSELIITGTQYLSAPHNIAYNRHDGLFYSRYTRKHAAGTPAGRDCKISAYPLPSQDKVHISLMNEYPPENLRVMLYDCAGKKVFDNTIQTANFDLDVAKYPVGIYLLKVADRNQSCVTKIVK